MERFKRIFDEIKKALTAGITPLKSKSFATPQEADIDTAIRFLKKTASPTTLNFKHIPPEEKLCVDPEIQKALNFLYGDSPPGSSFDFEKD